MIYENFSDADNSLFEDIMNHVLHSYFSVRRDSFDKTTFSQQNVDN